MRVSTRTIVARIFVAATVISACLPGISAQAEDSLIKAAFREETSPDVKAMAASDAPPSPPSGLLETRKRRRPPSVRKATRRNSARLAGYRPRHERLAATHTASQSVLVEAPIEMYDGQPADIEFDLGGPVPGGPDDEFCDSCGSDNGDCGSCGVKKLCFQVCLPVIESLQVGGGVQGFKGPGNLGQDSSFGFYESLNMGIPLDLFGSGIGAQFGIRGVQSNISGANPRTSDRREQVFLTAGLFRRVDCGLQFGAVIDYLSESWDRSIDLTQVRGEISWVHSSRNEIGFQIASGLDTSFDSIVRANVGATDTYSIFYRYRTKYGGVAKLYAGGSNNSEGLAGGDLFMPFNDSWGFISEFAYLVPQNGAGGAGNLQEAWNIGLGIVWQPGHRLRQTNNYYRPLFRVADNGLFFVDTE